MAEAEFQYSETAINKRDEDTKEYDVELPGVVANDDTATNRANHSREAVTFLCQTLPTSDSSPPPSGTKSSRSARRTRSQLSGTTQQPDPAERRGSSR